MAVEERVEDGYVSYEGDIAIHKYTEFCELDHDEKCEWVQRETGLDTAVWVSWSLHGDPESPLLFEVEYAYLPRRE